METRIVDEIKQDPTLGPVVERADRVLRELFGNVRHPPSASWQPSSIPQDGPRVELEMAEHDAFVGRDFRIDQLADERGFRYAVTDLWGDLIMLAYGRSNERLLEALRELRKEEENREFQVQGA